MIILQLGRGRHYITIYLESVRNEKTLDVLNLLEGLRTAAESVTITDVIDDTKGLGRIRPRRLGYLDLMEARHGP